MKRQHEDQVIQLVRQSLDLAEKVWNEVKGELRLLKAEAALEMFDEAVPSTIPGYPLVDASNPVVDDFVALVADMRDSSVHLRQAISSKDSNVSQLERVFYETSALLPALAKTIQYRGGAVTEYLGDGLLALFQVDQSNVRSVLRAARRAAIDAVTHTRKIVNDELMERYQLPPISLGVGLARSRAMVGLVGMPGSQQPKVIGECVYRAAKLAGGKNEVVLDKVLQKSWPKSAKGKLVFKKTEVRGHEGFLVQEKECAYGG